MRKFIFPAALLAAGLLLTGCSTPGTVATTVPEAAKSSATEVEKSEPETADPPVEVTDDPSFGESYEYEDGTTIVVSTPRRLASPGDGLTWDDWAEFSTVPKGKAPITITMTITAGLSSIDPTGATMTVLADDEQIDAECFGEGVNCFVSLTSLRPGKSVKLVESFWLSKGAVVTVEGSPTFLHEAALYGDWK